MRALVAPRRRRKAHSRVTSLPRSLSHCAPQHAHPLACPLPLRSYAPWCGECRAFKSELERAGELATSNALPFTLARINAPSAMDIASEYDIKSLPAYVLFRDGVAIPFPSLHTSEAMLAGAC